MVCGLLRKNKTHTILDFGFWIEKALPKINLPQLSVTFFFQFDIIFAVQSTNFQNRASQFVINYYEDKKTAFLDENPRLTYCTICKKPDL
jgi:hypothetical protein